MTSPARSASCSMLVAAARASSRSGGSWASHRMHALAFKTAAVIGCLISWANEAASSPQHADAVDMRQVRFQLVQSCFLVFGKLALGHVYGCADYLNDV